jgi:hypothetical protein
MTIGNQAGKTFDYRVYLGNDNILFNMASNRLINEFIEWIKDPKKQPGYFDTDATGALVAINFNKVCAIKEVKPDGIQDFQQQSQALAGRTL